ncbi:hypothetical protein EXW94_20410 [Enterobacter sp. JMULE2]|uniref:hypothetical protein n=1 Tax=Enterobacter TaxID=547 RepID=UPI0015751511|nr:hypothetical protein [Enterobacter sp. JMULE2]NTZ40018.1 hypothetical protein [Enterobacter sp. JMULE2]
MTTTHEIKEIQPRMTREQLIKKARETSKLLPKSWAALMEEIATRLDINSIVLCEAMTQRKILIDSLKQVISVNEKIMEKINTSENTLDSNSLAEMQHIMSEAKGIIETFGTNRQG